MAKSTGKVNVNFRVSEAHLAAVDDFAVRWGHERAFIFRVGSYAFMQMPLKDRQRVMQEFVKWEEGGAKPPKG